MWNVAHQHLVYSLWSFLVCVLVMTKHLASIWGKLPLIFVFQTVVIFYGTILNNECRFQEPYCYAGCPLMQCMLTLFVFKVVPHSTSTSNWRSFLWNMVFKLLVLQNMIACFYLSKVLWNPQNTTEWSHCEAELQTSWDSVSLGVPSAFLTSALPAFSGSFPVLLNQTFAMSGNWFPGTLLFSSNDSSRWHWRCSN